MQNSAELLTGFDTRDSRGAMMHLEGGGEKKNRGVT